VTHLGPLLQAALNGDRVHPAAPRTPGELAAEARSAVDAGARSLHLHPSDEEGRETLAAGPCAAALHAVRTACPGVPISLSTSAAIEADPKCVELYRELGKTTEDSRISPDVRRHALGTRYPILLPRRAAAACPDLAARRRHTASRHRGRRIQRCRDPRRRGRSRGHPRLRRDLRMTPSARLAPVSPMTLQGAGPASPLSASRSVRSSRRLPPGCPPVGSGTPSDASGSQPRPTMPSSATPRERPRRARGVQARPEKCSLADRFTRCTPIDVCST